MSKVEYFEFPDFEDGRIYRGKVGDGRLACWDGSGMYVGWDGDVPRTKYKEYVGRRVVYPPEAESKPTNPKEVCGIAKAPISTVPAQVLAEAGVALLEGALKYGRHNYRDSGVRSSVYYDATWRHLSAWWEGQDTDPDSGLSHITKAIASLIVLRDAQIQGMQVDDRPPATGEFYSELNKHVQTLLERHKDKNPKHYTRENKSEQS